MQESELPVLVSRVLWAAFALAAAFGATAMGCTVGQRLSGLSTLAPGSFIAMAGILAGAVLALRWQVWRLERQA